jgi:energy-coupling factor transport system ATP-binding protein
MIRFDDVTITYADTDRPVLRDVDLEVPAGELCVVVGATGSGKSTLLGAVNGLVPHFTGGTLRGRVSVDGRDTEAFPPRELADVVGVVTQDPLAGCVTDTLEEELAYGMEQLAIEPSVMRKRVEETLDLLGLADLRHRALYGLSAGQMQRVAIGAVLTAHPKVLVLDEPTSALDPTGAEEVLAAITRLVHDLGVTVMMAEHRLERVVQYADRVVYLPGDGTVVAGEPDDVLARSSVVPPVVELGVRAGWEPLPLSVRDARRRAVALTDGLATVDPPPAVQPSQGATDIALRARGIVVRFGAVVAVHDVDIDLRAGEVAALMGRNGSGKSSLLWSLQGTGARTNGRVDVGGDDPAALEPARARLRVGLVPHNPADLLYLDSVGEELARADAEAHAPADATRATLDRLAPGVADDVHPRDLSEGQRLSLVLAIQLAGAPTVLLLDEPTRGLDYRAKRDLGRILGDLAAAGHAIVIATHDVEFVAETAHRVIVMAEGEVVADGPTADVIVASPAFAPQVAKILAPRPWLTVEQLDRAGVFDRPGEAQNPAAPTFEARGTGGRGPQVRSRIGKVAP